MMINDLLMINFIFSLLIATSSCNGKNFALIVFRFYLINILLEFY